MQRNEVLTIPRELSGSRANKKTKFVVGGVVIVLAILYLIYTGIQSSSAYFLTVDELHARSDMVGRTVRVSGWVDANTIEFNNKELILDFEIFSDEGGRLPVVFNGPKPDQMREGAEAIVEGKFDGNQFTAQTLLLKCPSRYEGEPEQVQVEAVR
jgi:cytochrome c-type biogenesis protein CcmE